MQNKFNKILILFIIIIVFLNIMTLVVAFRSNSDVNTVNAKVQYMEKIDQDRNVLDAKIVETIKLVADDVTELKSRNIRQTDSVSRGGINRVIPKKSFNRLTGDTDLCQNVDLTADDMDKIIDDWDDCVKNGTSFKGKGEVFIKASKETGLNPVYILAHAAWESRWGNSYISKTKGNYFGINAVDHNPDKAYSMGNSVDEGIVAGAKWIKSEYYDHGHTTLNAMIYNEERGAYASDKDNWINGITSIVNSSYKVLS